MTPFSYASLANVELLEEMHAQYVANPESVDSSWRHFFEGMEFGAYRQEGAVTNDMRVYHLVDAYRTFGHLHAQVNPVATEPPPQAHELDLKTFGFSESELDVPVPSCGMLEEEEAPLRALLDTLQETYAGGIGVEYMDLVSPTFEKWLQAEIEPTHFAPRFSLAKKREILHQLNQAELFETFLHTRYVGQKRFSLEGGETLIPLLHEMVETGSGMGADEFVIGMPHRGRLNVLANVLGKSYSAIFGEFEDFYDPDLTEGTGDVKYHKGFSADVVTEGGRKVHLGLVANPSHLESVDPVVEGSVRAKQTYRGDAERKRVVPVLIHGDASVAGQGVVYESMQFCQLKGYATGGTIHIVVNNQIGFTALPQDSRSTRYCTDIAKTFSAPVFHVNGEDPERCVYAMQLAMKIRQQFHCDVFIDLNCYRKYGHNEGDEPAFTQPLEYQLIRKKKSVREVYRDRLLEQGVVEREVAGQLEKEFQGALHHELEEMKIKREVEPQEAFGGVWAHYRKGTPDELFEPVETAVEKGELKEVAAQFCAVPDGFSLHPKVVRLMKDRAAMEEKVDWGMGEHLALATLLWEGTPVRLAGQDSCRGTFSQRHAVCVDQKSGMRYFPLSHLKEGQGPFAVYDSLLSEYAALGFEFGYSLAYPSALVLWEAQFGDFANGGQVVIDQYISCSEQKWMRYSGLVLLLPHGYEGQGPEHSSARIERFLQLAGGANMQVCNPTTPAQYFHLLRRQVKRTVRKPLIVFTPKGLLRHPECVSPFEAFTKGTFEEFLDDPDRPQKVERLLLCSGRIAYDLMAEREKRKAKGVAIVRLEQLYPFHEEKFREVLAPYLKAKECFWVQEEPRNMGAWGYIHPLLLDLLPKEMELQFVGRNRSASPATGSHGRHVKEHEQLMERTFG